MNKLTKIKARYQKVKDALEESEQKYRTLIENVNIGIYRNTGGSRGRFLQVNPAMVRMFGYKSIVELTKILVSDLYQNPEDRRLFIKELLRKGSINDKELRLRKKDGRPIWCSCTAKVRYDGQGNIKWIDGVIEDITTRKKAEERLRHSEVRLRSFMNSATDRFLLFDAKLKLIEVNRIILKGLGIKKCELIGKHILKISPDLKKKGIYDKYLEVVRTGKPIVIEDYTTHPKFGDKQFTIKAFKVGGGLGIIATDISKAKQSEKKLATLNQELLKTNKRFKQLALKDSHTGLYNHRYLMEVIEKEFYRAKRDAHPLSVIMFDIDYFKSINDVYGHQFGDLVLKQFAASLKKMVRKYDTVVRFGGEEFVLLSPGTDRSTALSLAQRILDYIRTNNFGNRKQTVQLKLSLAVASYPEDNISKGLELVDLADKILNKVKEDGGDKAYSSLDIKKEKSILLGKIEQSQDVLLLKEKLDKLNKRAHQSLIEAVFAFAKTIKLKDHYTGEHVENTVKYAAEIAKTLSLSKEDVERVRQAAVLHDLGKIGISERILLKKSKLTPKEYEEIKKHPQIAADIIRPIQFLHSLIPLILYHHERWDGKGYPSGLKGEEIPIGARIISIADIFQALTSDRPYRKAYLRIEAIKIIKKGANIQFDPAIVDVFLLVLEKEK